MAGWLWLIGDGGGEGGPTALRLLVTSASLPPSFVIAHLPTHAWKAVQVAVHFDRGNDQGGTRWERIGPHAEPEDVPSKVKESAKSPLVEVQWGLMAGIRGAGGSHGHT